ncbi:hypothetical protein ACHAWF_016352 [Thalassiosira exigua]
MRGKRLQAVIIWFVLGLAADTRAIPGIVNRAFVDGLSIEAELGLSHRSSTGVQTDAPSRFLEATTQDATVAPVPGPTDAPTISSSGEPSKHPTASPTNEPTKKPTAQPTKEPTGEPTQKPTGFPSRSPSSEPTKEPTKEVSKSQVKILLSYNFKTHTFEQPTAIPTKPPSKQPTKMPSVIPTRPPSRQPSKQPTKAPTKFPSGSPSRRPSKRPTSLPTAKPTKMPTRNPSRPPSRKPTKRPSPLPTKQPTKVPISISAALKTPHKAADFDAEPISLSAALKTPHKAADFDAEPIAFSAALKTPYKKPLKAPYKAADKDGKPTLTPSRSPSSKPTNPPTRPLTNMPTMSPSKVPTQQPSDLPSRGPTLKPIVNPVADEGPTLTPSLSNARRYETNVPTSEPSQTQINVNVSGVLDFRLPVNRLLDSDEVVAFENTVEVLLERQGDMDEAYSNYNVTVISQNLTAVEPADTSPSNVRGLVRRQRMLEESESHLIVNTVVTAKAAPANDVNSSFQNAIHGVLSRHSDEFYETLFSSSAFEDLSPETEQVLDSVNLESQGGENGSIIAIGSAFVGIAMFLSLVVAFALFVRRRQGRQPSVDGNEDGDDDMPPAVSFDQPAEGSDDFDDVSSLNDSLLVDKYPYNVPHTVTSGQSSAETNKGGKANADAVKNSSPSSYQWSLDEPFPLKRADVSRISDGDKTVKASSTKGDLKQDVFVPCDEDESANDVKHDSHKDPKSGEESKEEDEMSVESGLKRLYDKAIVEDDKNTNEDEDLVDISLEDVVPEPKPNAARPGARGLSKMFSCFADNTFQEPKTSSTPKMSNTTRSNANSNVYEVRAPPGPLGVVVDSSQAGPVVVEVKESSPLFRMVAVGDIIMTVDGVNCQDKNAVALAHWISTKPYAPEQVLTLMSSRSADPESDEDMSI